MQKLSYLRLEPFKSAQTRDKLTNEQRFWKRYENTTLATLPSTAACISSNRNANQLFLYANGRALSIYDTAKAQVVKEINFTANLTALCLRPDAATMAIADENGAI